LGGAKGGVLVKLKHALFIASLTVFLCPAGSQAAVVNSADVNIAGNPYRTFIDQNTNLTWLDLDNFWDATSTYNSIVALLAGSGFHLANLTELSALQSSMPAIPANFTSESVIVGGNYFGNPAPGADRNLEWGIYQDGNAADGVSYSWKDAGWNFGFNVVGASTTLRSINTRSQDLGAWIVSDAVINPTPVPAALPLFATGFGVLGLLGWRRKRKTVALAG
jgi:hypothetical protein